MIIDSNSKRPNLEYPCKWSYKVIGSDVEKLISAIEECAGILDYEITPSNISKNGKYYSLNFTVHVTSEDARDLIYEKLNSHKDIRLVL